MNTQPNLRSIIKHPSAFLPIMMSFLAVSVVVVHIIWHGLAGETDEGVAAHLWQLLMAGQLPIIGFFVMRWLPRAGISAAVVLGLQVLAALAALAPVYFLHW
jgi:hypothetical protein